MWDAVPKFSSLTGVTIGGQASRVAVRQAPRAPIASGQSVIKTTTSMIDIDECGVPLGRGCGSGAVTQADSLERWSDSRAGVQAADIGDDAQVLAPSEVRMKFRLLDERSNPAQGLAPPLRDREPEQVDVSRRARRQADQHADQGRLAGAVVARGARRRPRAAP
jgi:hypothetical protein